MKLGIIGSSLSDFHLMYHLHTLDHEFFLFMDDRYGPWGQLIWEDSLLRLKECLKLAEDCEYILVPPLYELFLLHTQDSDYIPYKQKIVPLFTQLIHQQILNYSIVGKIALLVAKNHSSRFAEYWKTFVSAYTPSSNQINNKHFQKQFPLYPVRTDHWNMLYELPRVWFVNKLIKQDLAKLKDYNVDTILALDWSYLKYSKVIKQKFHNKIRRYDEKIVFGILDELLKSSGNLNSESKYAVSLYYTGNLPLEGNKSMKRALERGKNTTINFGAVTF